MARLRMFLAWLLLAAVPLQGLAAASMLFCGAPGVAQQGTSIEHHHRQHDGQHAAAGQADFVHQHAGHPPDGTSLPDAGHQCSACAACCHGAAISDAPRVPAAPAAPQSVRAERVVAMHSRPGSVPDKPPRA